MRRKLLPLLLAALAAVVMAVPLWAALTSERSRLSIVTFSPVRPSLPAHPLAEAATLVLTGGVLIGLASAVRRNS